MSFRQLLIGDLIKERGVCFQVTPKTGLQIQKLFNQKVAVKDAPYLLILDDGTLDCGYEPHEGYEQIIIAPQKFDSTKEFMEFLVMGGVTVDNDGNTCFLGINGDLSNGFYGDWKPRIDKSTANNPDNPV